MDEIKKEFPWISYGDLWTLGMYSVIIPAKTSYQLRLQVVSRPLDTLLVHRSLGDQDESMASSTMIPFLMGVFPMPVWPKITSESSSTEWVSMTKRSSHSLVLTPSVDVTLIDPASMDHGNSPQPPSLTSTSGSCQYPSSEK
jgi:hypothetical protein